MTSEQAKQAKEEAYQEEVDAWKARRAAVQCDGLGLYDWELNLVYDPFKLSRAYRFYGEKSCERCKALKEGRGGQGVYHRDSGRKGAGGGGARGSATRASE